MGALGDRVVRELVDRFARAWETRDVQSLVAMLAEDARMTMPPQPSWYQGRDAIDVFLGRWPLAPKNRFRFMTIAASGQPALAGYIWDEETGAFEPECIVVLTLRDHNIEEITAFRNPELFLRFGLPEQPPT
jgi:RNA polymerase sigma-70 factor (ECF subfamily)